MSSFAESVDSKPVSSSGSIHRSANNCSRTTEELSAELEQLEIRDQFLQKQTLRLEASVKALRRQVLQRGEKISSLSKQICEKEQLLKQHDVVLAEKIKLEVELKMKQLKISKLSDNFANCQEENRRLQIDSEYLKSKICKNEILIEQLNATIKEQQKCKDTSVSYSCKYQVQQSNYWSSPKGTIGVIKFRFANTDSSSSIYSTLLEIYISKKQHFYRPESISSIQQISNKKLNINFQNGNSEIYEVSDHNTEEVVYSLVYNLGIKKENKKPS